MAKKIIGSLRVMVPLRYGRDKSGLVNNTGTHRHLTVIEEETISGEIELIDPGQFVHPAAYEAKTAAIVDGTTVFPGCKILSIIEERT